MGNVPVVVNGTPRNITDWSCRGVSVGGIKSAVEKAMGIPRDKQHVCVGLLDVTNCEDSKTFCTSSYGELYVVDDEHPESVPKYVVPLTDCVGTSREAVLKPSPDIRRLKTQLTRNLELDIGLSMFEAECETGVLDNDGMWKFKPWNTLRLVYCPFKMGCTIVRMDNGETRSVEVDVDPKWTLLKLIQSLDVPMGEYNVTVDGKSIGDLSRELAWGAGAHNGSPFHVEVYPSPGFKFFHQNYTKESYSVLC